MGYPAIAKSMEEFDRRFDDGEDVHELIDISKAKIIRYGKMVCITLNMPKDLINELNSIKKVIGVGRKVH